MRCLTGVVCRKQNGLADLVSVEIGMRSGVEVKSGVCWKVKPNRTPSSPAVCVVCPQGMILSV